MEPNDMDVDSGSRSNVESGSRSDVESGSRSDHDFGSHWDVDKLLASSLWREHEQGLLPVQQLLLWILTADKIPFAKASYICNALTPEDEMNISHAAKSRNLQSLRAYGNRPSTPPVANFPSNLNYSPTMRSEEDIKKEINDFCRLLEPTLRDFIAKGKDSVPKWRSSGSGSGAFHKHVSTLQIPEHNDQPSLLLHDLGVLAEPDATNVHGLFCKRKKTLLCNVSGSGKTRLLLQGLYIYWGFYFVCQVDYSNIGSRDMQNCISHLPQANGWIQCLPEDQGKAILASNTNDLIVSHQIKKILLSRLIILNHFLRLSEDHGGVTDRSRELWTLLQVSPTVFQTFTMDIFLSLYLRLAGISSDFLNIRIQTELDVYTKRVNKPLVCVIDEAQAATRSYEASFISGSHPSESRPVLKSICNAMVENFDLIVSGTDVSIDTISTAISSSAAKDEECKLFHETGSLDNIDRHAAYMQKYLPATMLQDEAGKQLMKRALHWLRGRYRFTTAFVALLLENGGRSPHRILDAFIHHFTGCWPNDGGNELRRQEPAEIPVVRLKLIYNVEELQNNANLLKDASRIICRYMTGRKPLPEVSSHPKVLVELGFARFLNRTVLVDEILAILSLARWLEERPGFTLKDFLHDSLAGATNVQMRGFIFENVVTFYYYTVFRDFIKLSKVFNFVSPAPEWATQRARLITFTRGENGEYQWAQVNCHDVGGPRLPSAPMATDSGKGGQEAVVSWLKDQKYIPIFLPTNLMGPDHLMLLELEDGRRVWVLTQVKLLEESLSGINLENAIRSVTPPFFSGHPVGKKRSKLRTDSQGAMGNVPNPVPGNPPVLRVVMNGTGTQTGGQSAGEVPLATIDMEHFGDETCSGVTGVIVDALRSDQT